MASVLPYCYSSTLICNFQMLLSPPPINYSVPIKVICGRSTFVPVLYLASFKTHYNSVITSNPLGVTICLLHAAHAYRNTLMQKKSVEYKEGRTWMQSRLRRGDRNISATWKHAESRNGGAGVLSLYSFWAALELSHNKDVWACCYWSQIIGRTKR